MSRAVEFAEEWLKRIKDQVSGVQYGTVQITIHDGQIVQIDRTERSRYDTAKAQAGLKKPR